MMTPTCSPLIVRHETPPADDQEWDEALKLYGADRQDNTANQSISTKTSEIGIHLQQQPETDEPQAHGAPVPCRAVPPRPLIHHEHSSDGELPPQDMHLHDGEHDNNRRAQWRQQMNRQFSWNTDVRVLDGTAADGLSLTPRSLTPERFGERALNGSDTGNTLTPRGSIGGVGHTFGIIDKIGLPRPISPLESGAESTAIDERRRLRDYWERYHWLPAPTPSRQTLLKRARAIRRLGLNDEEDDGERHAVIAKYAELAQQIFATTTAAVCILRDDDELVYGIDPEQPMYKLKAAEATCGHAVLSPFEMCTVVADMSQDWRFKHNPNRLNFPHKFYAAAPLRYHRPGIEPIDIGTICLFDNSHRDTFDGREHGMLLRLANMLVFQLATLQSEIMAKKSSAMYEASISFLRRSVIPDHLKPASQQSDTTVQRKRPSKNKKRTTDAKVKVPRSTQMSRKVVTANSEDRNPRPPLRAIKTGPKDTKDAKRKDLIAESAMFTDAAETLRGILQSDAVVMVDMHEYQLFIRKTKCHESDGRSSNETKETIIADFLQGNEWPSHIEPVVNYVPKSNSLGLAVLGKSAEPGLDFHFDTPEVAETLAQFIKTYLMTRHFWWDREDAEDSLAKKVMCLMPGTSQTVLATVFMAFDGTLRYATFASWARPPSAFDDGSRLALPFVWIVGGTLIASLAIRRMRLMEQSQISYSNLQAHELRTPLHQILAITQLLRSAMSDLAEAPVAEKPLGCLTTLQQIRDLLPFLDAIDTSGKTLHGIVDNILSFLDLKAKDGRWQGEHPGLISSPAGAPQTLEVMFEELIHEAYEEDKRSRRATGQPVGRIETIFEVIPDRLGELVTEDGGGALRKALGKVLSNAYRYIEGEGRVEIYVDDVSLMMPPEGYEDLSSSKRISIKIIDNGHGMTPDFVRDKLGEPWAKEDLYATGSGLSVHLAYRIIDLMGGNMEISSAPGEGCTVTLEVPVPRVVSTPTTPQPDTNSQQMLNVAFLGFERLGTNSISGIDRLGESMKRQYMKLGCRVVPVEEAEVVVADGAVEELADTSQLMRINSSDLVIFVSDEHEVSPQALALQQDHKLRVRRFHKPVTPSLIRESLRRTATVEHVARPRTHFDSAAMSRPGTHTPATGATASSSGGIGASFSWKPKGICVEEAVASLCLGDYFSSRARLARAPSTSSAPDSVTTGDSIGDSSTPPSLKSGTLGASDHTPSEADDDLTTPDLLVTTPPQVKVLVVEDNMINRKILVKILSSKLSLIDILEAEDGQDAVDRFRELSDPAIVLLDINMPKMDGYAAATEMRSIEKRRQFELGSATRSKIIAVTALGSDAEKRRGLVECSMDSWLTKPCGKATIQKVVEEARRELLGLER